MLEFSNGWDAVSETDGFTLIEKRLVSVAIRNGTNEA